MKEKRIILTFCLLVVSGLLLTGCIPFDPADPWRFLRQDGPGSLDSIKGPQERTFESHPGQVENPRGQILGKVINGDVNYGHRAYITAGKRGDEININFYLPPAKNGPSIKYILLPEGMARITVQKLSNDPAQGGPMILNRAGYSFFVSRPPGNYNLSSDKTEAGWIFEIIE